MKYKTEMTEMVDSALEYEGLYIFEFLLVLMLGCIKFLSLS